MTAVDMFIKSGDTLPALYTTLTDAAGKPIDLTTATLVTFQMALEGTSDLSVSQSADIVGSPIDGNVQYQWAADDTGVPGSYFGNFAVTYPGGVQTYPSDDFINILVQPNLTDVTAPVQTFCTTSDIKTITNQDVEEHDVNVAWAVIEDVAGRPLYELIVGGDQYNTLTNRDEFWLKKAIAWQAVFVKANPDIFSAFDVVSTNQSGQSATFNPDGIVLAPMARHALRWVTWCKTRSVKIQRPYPYGLLTRNSSNDNVGPPWSGM